MEPLQRGYRVLTSTLFVALALEALLALADVVGREVAALGVGDAPGCKLWVQTFVDICKRKRVLVIHRLWSGFAGDTKASHWFAVTGTHCRKEAFSIHHTDDGSRTVRLVEERVHREATDNVETVGLVKDICPNHDIAEPISTSL